MRSICYSCDPLPKSLQPKLFRSCFAKPVELLTVQVPRPPRTFSVSYSARLVVTAGAKTGTGKRFPTIPTVSRVSFDFLHYIRPPQEAVPVSREAFDQLLGALTTFDRGADVLPKTRERLRVNLLRNVCHVLYFECEQVKAR